MVVHLDSDMFEAFLNIFNIYKTGLRGCIFKKNHGKTIFPAHVMRDVEGVICILVYEYALDQCRIYLAFLIFHA